MANEAFQGKQDERSGLTCTRDTGFSVLRQMSLSFGPRVVCCCLAVVGVCLALTTSGMNYDEIMATFGDPREKGEEIARANQKAEEEFREKAPSMSVSELRGYLTKVNRLLREIEMQRIQMMQDGANSMLSGRSYAAYKRRLHIVERNLRHNQELRAFIEDLLVKKGANLVSESDDGENGRNGGGGSDFWKTLSIALMASVAGFVFAAFYFRRQRS